MPAAWIQRRRYRNWVAWLIEQHLIMSTVAQSRDLSDRQDHRKFRRGGAIGRTDEAADDPDTADIRGVGSRGLERLEGAAGAHAVL